MPVIDDIDLLRFEGAQPQSGIALPLSAPARRSRTLDLRADGWEVELRTGGRFAVARTCRRLSEAEILSQGIDAVHRSLDLVALVDGDPLFTQSPAAEHVIALRSDAVVYRSARDVPVDMSMQMTVTHADGTVETPEEPPPPPWSVAFRFHRLSQTSRDLFDAYRNLFLGTEALFDQLFPKAPSEGERAWLLRAVREAGARVELSSVAPPGSSDLPAAIVNLIYGVRVQLFHAKTGRALVPDDQHAYFAVAEAYPVLLGLWTETVRRWLGMARGGGVVTFAGFRIMMSAAYAAARCAVTRTLPPTGSGTARPDAEAGPWLTSASPVDQTEPRPGQMTLAGNVDIPSTVGGFGVGHAGLVAEDGAAMLVAPIPGGLAFLEPARFRSEITMRLRNAGSPKTEFA